ncbi:hypothetical protein ACIQCG_34075 [Streptomyces noursei]|uniref:hypothetical protein n=1 Tax=Streptomyces noursei TaxID=1971 RepID=UPI0037FB8861
MAGESGQFDSRALNGLKDFSDRLNAHCTVRYERKASHFLAFLGLAASLTCYKKITKLTV